MNKIETIEYLINNINIKNINMNIINENIEYLTDIFVKIKIIWNSIKKNNLSEFDNEYIKIDKSTELYNDIYNLIKESYLNKYDEFNKFININNSIIKLEYENIKFYYFYDINFDKDLLKIIFLLKITICLNKYYINDDKIERIIIWIPINKNRDFKYNKINKNNLLKSLNNFEAFTASGLTFGNDPRITIISRYEEIEKLLLHELIHNFYIDGSIYHKKFKQLINNYKNTKIKLTKSQNYDYDYSIYESYSELAGTYLFILFSNINLNTEEIKDKLTAQIIIELLYSLNTVVNLSKINGYTNYDEFIINEVFYGDICIYEYYYIKGLMYNNFKFRFCKNINEFIELYNDIIKIMKSTKNDKLLENIFNNSINNQNNYKYTLIN